MKFVSSFSTGKDSMLALHKMVLKGHEPIGIIVMYNPKAERSWFHGAGLSLLETISKSLDIPLICCETTGDDYHIVMEKALKEAKKKGAEACVFGDIDLQGHRDWNEERCSNAGLKAILPLWQEDRESLVKEVINLGYKCIIKCVNREQIPESFLGKVLSEEILEEMRKYQIDLCGENGEYHTIVCNGPLFKNEVPITYGKIHRLDNVSAIEMEIGE